MQTPISRLAPTPSGFLHKGNAFNFLLNWLLTRSANGKVLLRIDDLSTKVVLDEHLEDVFQSIEWLGLDWDMGPNGIDDFKKNWSQHLRRNDYEKQIRILKEKNILFACKCSRKILADSGHANLYPGTCLKKKIPLESDDVSLRINVANNKVVVFNDNLIGLQKIEIGHQPGSFVIRRRDKLPGYHISTLVDDVLFNVNVIARGDDLLESTAVQLYLANQLGIDSFAETKFYHHPLIEEDENQKLSKSLGSLSLKVMRQGGFKPEMFYREFAAWIGLKEKNEINSLTDLLEVWKQRK